MLVSLHPGSLNLGIMGRGIGAVLGPWILGSVCYASTFEMGPRSILLTLKRIEDLRRKS